ncbi:MAG: hypothetical protein IT449_15480 [Phycisphaerales bacterium]|nr:hypothetical protein [Phycisphaerales bacterium]
MAFTYGDGALDCTDPPESCDLDSGSEAEPTQLYWSFLPSAQLASSDPNRLVREQRTLIDESYSGGEAVTFDKEYRYDANGNRLALVERDADTGYLLGITRYNYMFEYVGDGTDVDDPPGTPDTEYSQWMDYAGHGRDQLMSTQKFIFDGDASSTLDRVVAEAFDYVPQHPHVTGRIRKTFRWDADLQGGRWWTQVEESTAYEYDNHIQRLQKQEYWFKVYDLPDEGEFGDLLDQGAIGEISGYDDLLGRRIAAFRCDAEDSTDINWGPTGDCKARTTMFDYYGLSQRVAAVRLSPWRWVGGGNGHYEKHGDEFNESYTYGPVGVTTRTVETEDADPGDNFDHWVLPDIFGGTAGLLLDDAQPAQRAAVFEHFDAFGVRAGPECPPGPSRSPWRLPFPAFILPAGLHPARRPSSYPQAFILPAGLHPAGGLKESPNSAVLDARAEPYPCGSTFFPAQSRAQSAPYRSRL